MILIFNFILFQQIFLEIEIIKELALHNAGQQSRQTRWNRCDERMLCAEKQAVVDELLKDAEKQRIYQVEAMRFAKITMENFEDCS